MSAFPDYPLDEGDYVLAASFFNACRAAGVQGSSTDFLICAASANHGLSIFTTDDDFVRLAARLPIRLHDVGGA